VNGEPYFERQWQDAASDLQQRIVDGKFPRRDLFLPHVPDRLCRAIRKALSVDPAKRFPSAAAFSNALAKVAIGNNWATTLNADGSMSWRADRNDSALLVALSKAGRTWAVSIYTEKEGKVRRSRTALWRNGMTKGVADIYLSQLFGILG
jgi:hypothetical protein